MEQDKNKSENQVCGSESSHTTSHAWYASIYVKTASEDGLEREKYSVKVPDQNGLYDKLTHILVAKCNMALSEIDLAAIFCIRLGDELPQFDRDDGKLWTILTPDEIKKSECICIRDYLSSEVIDKAVKRVERSYNAALLKYTVEGLYFEDKTDGKISLEDVQKMTMKEIANKLFR